MITYRGDEWEVSPVRGLSRFPSDQLHDIVGGFYETHELRNGQVMVINAGARWDDLPMNRRATDLMARSYPDEFDYVSGNVLVCDPDMID